MEIRIHIDEKKFDKSVGEVIKGKIRNVIRNDRYVGKLISEEVHKEVQKRVDNLFEDTINSINLGVRINELIVGKFKLDSLEVRQMVHNAIYQQILELKKPYLEDVNKAAIQELFKNEVTALQGLKKEKPVPPQNTVRGVSGARKQPKRFQRAIKLK